jgi:hypothetical protein
LNRRGFFKAAAAIGAAPIVAKLPLPELRAFEWDIINICPPGPIVSASTWTINEIVAATSRARSSEIAANVVANNALLRRLKKRV